MNTYPERKGHMGANMKHALAFVQKYPGWQSFAKDRSTVAAIKCLKERDLIEVNNFNQFREIA